MKEINYCSFTIYKDTESGLKAKACFIFEFDVEGDIVEEYSQDFVPGIVVEFQDIQNGMNELLHWNSVYYITFTFNRPFFIILSDYEFVFKSNSKGFIRGIVKKENLNNWGFNSLFELEAKKYQVNILFASKNNGTSNTNRVYMHPIFSWKKYCKNIGGYIDEL